MISKKIVLGVVVGVLVCLWIGRVVRDDGEDDGSSIKGTISISGAWALYPLMVQWSQAFQTQYPDVTFDMAAGGAGKGMSDALAKVVDLGMVSRDIYEVEIKKGAWWLSVTKDAVVPTINAANPMLSLLESQGVTRQQLIDVFVTGDVTRWSQLNDTDRDQTVHVFTRSDACGAAKTWAQYLGSDQEDLLGVGVYGDPGVAEAVAQDIQAMGYNNINFAYDPETKLPMSGIRVLPIDLNGDRVLDADESFYGSRDALVEAIAAGRYPCPPARDLHLVSGGRPTRAVVRLFLEWIMTDGQALISDAGYIMLSSERMARECEKLHALSQ